MRLRPSLPVSLGLLPLACLTAWLGFWQLERMAEKQELVDRFENAPRMELGEAIAENRQFARVSVSGSYEPGWSLLLDNKTLDGRVGVHVLTLFYPDQGDAILVNRGWLPMAPDRRKLPEVTTPSQRVTISGILNVPLEDGIRLGDSRPPEVLRGVQLITYLEMDAIAPLIEQTLSPWTVQLDAGDATGFAGRKWQPAVILPAQHGAYAIQWFALSVAIVIIWFTLSWRRSGSTGMAREGREPAGNRKCP